MAQHAAGSLDDAVDRLVRAVRLGVPAGYARLFLDEGSRMTDLLRELERRGSITDLLPALRRSDVRSNPATTPPPTPATSVALLEQGLSDRELDVLRLLATELTGPEIAKQLFVSINTLRTHPRHNLTKLDVTTRAAAVRRGRDLQLLRRRSPSGSGHPHS